jgi:hypothetical protein
MASTAPSSTSKRSRQSSGSKVLADALRALKRLQDKHQLAAQGYYQAFNTVRMLIVRVVEGENPSRVIMSGHQDGYAALFGPLDTAGIS